jgi:uncharacterized protein YajQ (UPF0234 family)
VAESSFDIEAGVDRQEVDNAINQAAREVATRFDFKDTDTVIAWSGDEAIQVESASEDRVRRRSRSSRTSASSARSRSRRSTSASPATSAVGAAAST